MKDLPIRDQTIAYLTVEGWSNLEIAESVGVAEEIIRLKLTDEKIASKVKNLQYQLYGEDHKKRFKEIQPLAIDAIEEILRDPTAKHQIKLSAAEQVLDRDLGKPKQTVEHEGSLIRGLLEKLNQADSPIIPVDFKEIKSENTLSNPNESLPHRVLENPNLKEDPIDNWINQNLK